MALIGLLMVLLSGLSVGLVNDGVSGLQKLPVSSFAFQSEVDKTSAFSRSVVDVDVAQEWADRDGVAEATPFGNTLVNTTTDDDVDIDLALFGVEPDSWLSPEATTGAALADPGEIVLAGTLQDEGVAVGDVVTVDQIGTELEVVGFLDGQHTYGHVDVGYVDLTTWQEVRAGVRPGEPVPDHVHDDATAVAVRFADGADVDLAAADAALRAVGASTRYLLRDSLTQSAVLLVGSTVVGVGAGLLLGAGISSSPMPFALEAAPVAGAAALLVVLGMVGAAIAVLRITRVDPLTALGGNR